VTGDVLVITAQHIENLIGAKDIDLTGRAAQSRRINSASNLSTCGFFLRPGWQIL
jgi:hypothetical protein